MKTLCFLLGALPLLAYPFFALPSAINLFAPRNPSMGAIQYGCGVAFSVAVLLYPVAYLVALLLTVTNRKEEAISHKTALIPLGYLLAIALLTLCWVGAEKAHL